MIDWNEEVKKANRNALVALGITVTVSLVVMIGITYGAIMAYRTQAVWDFFYKSSDPAGLAAFACIIAAAVLYLMCGCMRSFLSEGLENLKKITGTSETSKESYVGLKRIADTLNAAGQPEMLENIKALLQDQGRINSFQAGIIEETFELPYLKVKQWSREQQRLARVTSIKEKILSS